MKHILSILLLMVTLTSVASEKVPLEHFAEKSKFKSFLISPDGEHLAFSYDGQGQEMLAVMNIKSKKITTTFSSDGDGREIAFFMWASNKRIVMLTQKDTGWLDGQYNFPRLVAGNIDGSKRYELWDYQRSNLRVISSLVDEPKYILVGKSHFTDKGGMKLHKMNVFNGKLSYIKDSPKAIGSSNSRIVGIAVDTDNTPRVAIEFDTNEKNNDDDNVSYLHFKNDGKWSLLELPTNRDAMPLVRIAGFNKSNNKFYFYSNHDLKEDGTLGLFELNLQTKKINFLYRHPDVDFLPGVTGPDGELIAVVTQAGYTDFHYVSSEENAKEIAFHKSLRASFKGQDISISSYSNDKTLATLRVNSDKNPGEYFIFDRATNSAKYISSAMPNIKSKQMSSVEPFIMQARDGLKVYGSMTIPKGKNLKDLPLVIYPHGGPYGARDFWRWDARPQMLANNGYLVIQLDFRGSGGYGWEFQKAGFHEYGGKMIDDIVDAVNWAVSEGYADKNRVCIHGISYGGYASMQAAVKAPGVFKCTIPDAGFYDLKLQWETSDGTGKNEEYRKWWYTRMAGTSNTEEKLKEYSSAFELDKLQAEVMIVHGINDKRVSIKNAYDLEDRLKKIGKDYKTIYKEDGHGFEKKEYRVELYEKMLEFLNEHIGE